MSTELKRKPADNHSSWRDFYHHTVVPFWQQVQHHDFYRDGVRLHWVSYKVSDAAPLIVISPGRIEATIKYQELVWELAAAGISCAILDHRGQGQSERLTAKVQQGHVDKFDDFIQDFRQFNDELEQHFSGAKQRWLVGHSMGGTIATLFCSQYQHQYQQLILTSPMFSISTGRVPNWIAKMVVAAGTALNHWLMPATPWYFLGMGDYQPISFDKNELTHSENRYRAFRQAYRLTPEVQLGGPTFNWLYEAVKASDQIVEDRLSLNLPVTLFQAGADKVVTAEGQDRFAALNENIEKITLAGAKHELLMESDEYRQPIIDKLLALNAS